MIYIVAGSIAFAFIVTAVAVSVACSYGESIRQEALDNAYQACRKHDALQLRVIALEMKLWGESRSEK